ncbi:CBS domain-containing protein [Salidesulfovibrio brasiliensis]|uniref:CBS domain-containing protein n=1 Tax=Salidesulfovibrio brasiliensis TaxID=221711 RepID=UPI0006D0429C|nr:CBS domain-containing protein [Salidesulfovibrio brasiliensis]
MRIITTHTGTDFDALASMVACTHLYSGSVGVLPDRVNPEVKQFLALHGSILRVTPRKGFELGGVTSLVVVDANSWKRLDGMDALAKREELEIICWDHHMEGVTIESTETHREETGAAVTLLLEEMQRRDTPFTPMHATLFLLGIYSDTGGLRYPSATARDAAMTAFLLDNGADLNVVSAYLDDTVDDAHAEVFAAMLEESEIVELGELTIGISALQIKSGLTSLAPLVERFRSFKGLDAAFGLFQADSQKCMVIGRGKPKFIDVGQIMRTLGGGGHPGAGSAIIRKTSPTEAAEQMRALIGKSCGDNQGVRSVMSDPAGFTVGADATMGHVAARLADENRTGLMVCQGSTLLGGVSGLECAKAEKTGRLDVPVKGYTRRNIPRIAPDASCREAVALMVDAREGILAVVEDDELVGVITQTDLLFEVYDF